MIRIAVALVVSLHVAECCWGGGGGLPPKRPPKQSSEEAELTREERRDPIKRNRKAWNGFTIPDNVKEDWAKWAKDYKKQMKKERKGKGNNWKGKLSGGPEDETSEEFKLRLLKERGPGSGWPREWGGLGPGHGHVDPPPWSFQPINLGYPEYCYIKPSRGSCSQNLNRYAYNVYQHECSTFMYSGCGGNRNNFKTKEKCVEACMTAPDIGCDPEIQFVAENDYYS